MTTRPPMRCTYFTDRARCTADATHRIRDADGWRVPGGIYCEKHASLIVDEYREKLRWSWAIVPIEEEGNG